MTNSDKTLQPQSELPGFTARPATALLASILLSASACSTPPGRCGMPDLCDPVVMTDPFPNDQCVPAKGVDPSHSGYTRPVWRVLGERDPECCFPTTTVVPSRPPRAAAEQLPLGSPEPPPQRATPADDWSRSTAPQLHFSDIVPPPRRVPLTK